MSELLIAEQALWTPIPDQTGPKERHAAGYQHVPVDTTHRLYDDPLVSLKDYGIESRSYYSRKNVTGDPIPGVAPDVLVRRHTAERVARFNDFLRETDWVKRFCGGEVSVRVDEGLRSQALQQFVYDEQYPKFLRKTLKRGDDEDDAAFEARVLQTRDQRVGKPKGTPPHSTGGVVDLRIIRDDGENTFVDYGYVHANKPTVETDYFEKHPDAPNAERFAQVRRLVFHGMSELGGVVNPLEPWHFGFLDLEDPRYATDGLTAVVAGAQYRMHDAVPGTPEMVNN